MPTPSDQNPPMHPHSTEDLRPRRMGPDRLDSAPVFLVGCVRSGTTLLRLLLHQNSHIAFRNESEFLVDHLADDGTWPERRELLDRLVTDRAFGLSGFTLDEDLPIPDAWHRCLLEWFESKGGSVLGATVHRHFGRLRHIWPRARFIHIVRDPRDVARSCIGMGWGGNVWTTSAYWDRVEREWIELRNDLDDDRWIGIRYEEMLRDPKATLEKICDFLDVPFDQSMLAPPESSSYDAPDSTLAEQWRRKLSPAEALLVERRSHDLMTSLGYEPSGPLRPWPGPVEQLRLRIHNRWAMAFRWRRTLGTRLWIELAIARRLGPKRWRQSVMLRRHEAVNALRK
jgi:hypothetical protein